MSQQDIAIEFDNPMSQFFAGLQWDANPTEKKGFHLFAHHHDLDLFCALLDVDKNVMDVISSASPKVNEYRLQILHTGDNQTGASDLEDEEIRISLKMLNPDIHHIFFLISNKNGGGFEGVDAPFCHFMDSSTFRKFFSVDLRQHATPDEFKNDPCYFGAVMINRIPTKSFEGDEWSLTPVLKYIKDQNGKPDEREINLLARAL